MAWQFLLSFVLLYIPSASLTKIFGRDNLIVGYWICGILCVINFFGIFASALFWIWGY
jgi:hypothetical protein